jgi:hypothetical protein
VYDDVQNQTMKESDNKSNMLISNLTTTTLIIPEDGFTINETITDLFDPINNNNNNSSWDGDSTNNLPNVSMVPTFDEIDTNATSAIGVVILFPIIFGVIFIAILFCICYHRRRKWKLIESTNEKLQQPSSSTTSIKDSNSSSQLQYDVTYSEDESSSDNEDVEKFIVNTRCDEENGQVNWEQPLSSQRQSCDIRRNIPQQNILREITVAPTDVYDHSDVFPRYENSHRYDVVLQKLVPIRYRHISPDQEQLQQQQDQDQQYEIVEDNQDFRYQPQNPQDDGRISITSSLCIVDDRCIDLQTPSGTSHSTKVLPHVDDNADNNKSNMNFGELKIQELCCSDATSSSQNNEMSSDNSQTSNIDPNSIRRDYVNIANRNHLVSLTREFQSIVDCHSCNNGNIEVGEGIWKLTPCYPDIRTCQNLNELTPIQKMLSTTSSSFDKSNDDQAWEEFNVQCSSVADDESGVGLTLADFDHMLIHSPNVQVSEQRRRRHGMLSITNLSESRTKRKNHRSLSRSLSASSLFSSNYINNNNNIVHSTRPSSNRNKHMSVDDLNKKTKTKSPRRNVDMKEAGTVLVNDSFV